MNLLRSLFKKSPCQAMREFVEGYDMETVAQFSKTAKYGMRYNPIPEGFLDAIEANTDKNRTQTETKPKVMQCTQCGAPLEGSKCKYCGSVYVNASAIETAQNWTDAMAYASVTVIDIQEAVKEYMLENNH